jgi:hypothetical protein
MSTDEFTHLYITTTATLIWNVYITPVQVLKTMGQVLVSFKPVPALQTYQQDVKI